MALERYSIDLVFRCTWMSEVCRGHTVCCETDTWFGNRRRLPAYNWMCVSHSFTRSLDGPNDKGVLFDKAFWIEMFRIVHTLSWATWWMMSSSWTLSYIHGPVARCSAVKLQSTLENVDSGLRYTSLYSPTTCSTRGIFERPLLGSVNVQAAAYHIYIFAIRTSRKGTVTKYSWEALHKWPCSPFRRRRRKPFRQLSDAEVSFPYFCHSWFQCIVKDHLKYLFLTESRSGNEDDETGRCSMMLEGISKTEICLPSDIFDIKSQVEMWSGGCHRISQGHKFN